MGIEGFGRYGGASDVCEWVGICLNQYDQYQALHIHVHLKLFTPISGPSHSSQALHTHPKAFTPVSGPLYLFLVPDTFPWLCTLVHPP